MSSVVDILLEIEKYSEKNGVKTMGDLACQLV